MPKESGGSGAGCCSGSSAGAAGVTVGVTVGSGWAVKKSSAAVSTASGTMGVTVARMGARRSGSMPKVPPGPRMMGSMGSLPPSVTVVWSGPKSISKGARGRDFSTCTGAGSG